MEPEFIDRVLNCADCSKDFIFTAGEQLFFFDKQFKNDPKRCKPCKSRRSGLTAASEGALPASGLSRTETRTECSECGVETTVPFKPTQGRPVLCRHCFQLKARGTASPAAPGTASAASTAASTAATLVAASLEPNGDHMSDDAAQGAAASMQAAPRRSTIATTAELASILTLTTMIAATIVPPPPVAPVLLPPAAHVLTLADPQPTLPLSELQIPVQLLPPGD